MFVFTESTNFSKCFEKIYRFLTEREIFSDTLFKNNSFLLNYTICLAKAYKKRAFLWMNDFIEQTIFLNERFYCIIVQWQNEWNRGKINDDFENKWDVHERWTNRMKKSRTLFSCRTVRNISNFEKKTNNNYCLYVIVSANKIRKKTH